MVEVVLEYICKRVVSSFVECLRGAVASHTHAHIGETRISCGITRVHGFGCCPPSAKTGRSNKRVCLFVNVTNDPTAGSPTVSLLRLHLPLNKEI